MGRKRKGAVVVQYREFKELCRFLESRQSLTINSLCKEAGIPQRAWYNLFSPDEKKRIIFNEFHQQLFYEKLLPVMAKYGHT